MTEAMLMQAYSGRKLSAEELAADPDVQAQLAQIRREQGIDVPKPQRRPRQARPEAPTLSMDERLRRTAAALIAKGLADDLPPLERNR